MTFKEVKELLDSQLEEVQNALPDAIKGRAKHFITRAYLAVTANKKLALCSKDSLVRALIRSAETGLPMDGELAYLTTLGDEARFMPGYKGMVAAAKRCGAIRDAWAEVVLKGEPCKISKNDQTGHHVEHSLNLEVDRNNPRQEDVVGSYAVLELPDRTKRIEFIHIDELRRIRKSAPANSGSWNNYPNEMNKKTAVKRVSKLNCNDPWLQEIIAIDDEEYEVEKRSNLNDTVFAGVRAKPEPQYQGPTPLLNPGANPAGTG